MAYPYYQGYQQNYQQNYPQYSSQNGGIVRVASEDEARRYPVAPGYSVTFIDEKAEHCYTKTAGFSQLEQPVFKKYRLIAENEPQSNDSEKEDKNINYATKAEFEALRDEWAKFKKEINNE